MAPPFPAPDGCHELAIMPVGKAVASQIAPQISGFRFIDVGLILLQRKIAGDLAFIVVGTLVAAIGNLPGLLRVVGGNAGGGPDMAITGDLAAVIEVIENAELAGQGVLVGGNVLAKHGERGIAVARLEVA